MGEGVSTINKGARQERGSDNIGTGFADAVRKAQAESQARREAADKKVQDTNKSPKPTQVADMDSRKFKSAITRAHNYTDDNFHQVASATAAKAFGYTDIEKEFRQIEKEHDRAGYLTPALGKRVREWEDEIEARIRRDYGEKGIKAWNRAKS